jgi:hypothetical protein
MLIEIVAKVQVGDEDWDPQRRAEEERLEEEAVRLVRAGAEESLRQSEERMTVRDVTLLDMEDLGFGNASDTLPAR